MVLLKRLALTMAVSALTAALGWADASGFLTDWEVSGFIQGRALGQGTPLEEPAGYLNDRQPDPARPGGQAVTQALIQRAEFKLQTNLPWAGWGLYTQTAVGSPQTTFINQTTFLDFYLRYAPHASFSLRAGRFRVPFGLDLQTSSAEMDTVEKPLIYGFGNFGWVGPLGMNFIHERDYGVRADYAGAAGFANFAPLLQAAVVQGGGQNIQGRLPPQFVLRIGFSNHLLLEELQSDLIVGLSASAGNQHFNSPASHYVPIGISGSLNTAARIDSATDLGEQGWVSNLGLDALTRMNLTLIKVETVTRKVAEYTSHGYYVTGIQEFYPWVPLEAVVRWEEASQGYADGAHVPNQVYQALTAGLNWKPLPAWKIQANYIALLLDKNQHVFRGSDLYLLQVQWNF